MSFCSGEGCQHPDHLLKTNPLQMNEHTVTQIWLDMTDAQRKFPVLMSQLTPQVENKPNRKERRRQLALKRRLE